MAKLYHDGKPSVEAPGLSLVPKLKHEHIYLTSFSKMRVDLAAQVYKYFLFCNHGAVLFLLIFIFLCDLIYTGSQ